MNGLKTTAKKGDRALAEYVIDGRVKRQIDLGEVISINNSKKTFKCRQKDGTEVVRHYTFGATNGIRLKGFKSPEEQPKKAKKEEEASSEEE